MPTFYVTRGTHTHAGKAHVLTSTQAVHGILLAGGVGAAVHVFKGVHTPRRLCPQRTGQNAHSSEGMITFYVILVREEHSQTTAG